MFGRETPFRALSLMSSRILRWIQSDNKRLPRGAVTLKLSNRLTPTETHCRCQKTNLLCFELRYETQGLLFRLSRNLLCLLLTDWNNNSTTTDNRERRQFTLTSDSWMFHQRSGVVSISVPSSTECFLFTLLDGYIISAASYVWLSTGRAGS